MLILSCCLHNWQPHWLECAQPYIHSGHALYYTGSYDLPRMFLPRKSKCTYLEIIYLVIIYLECFFLETKPDLPRIFLPRNYLP
jgi:hypothetical protein